MHAIWAQFGGQGSKWDLEKFLRSCWGQTLATSWNKAIVVNLKASLKATTK